MSPAARAARALLLAAFLAGAACSDDPGVKPLCVDDAGCVADHDGNPNWFCDDGLGRCACTGDAACTGPAEHCEVLDGNGDGDDEGDGLCHPNRSCEWNPDCQGNEFCDTTTGICRLSGCSIDVHCAPGTVCNTFTHQCEAGCRSHGDCGLGDVCLCRDTQGNEIPCTCDGATDPERASCAIGQCIADTCIDKTFCGLGEQCVDLAAEERPVCQQDERGPYCENCIWGPGGARCGSEGPNFCLIDTSDPAGRASFCGVDCADGGDELCPNGFSCHDVLILTQSVCQGDGACVPTGGECRDDDACPPGARCVKAAGQEVGRCGGRCAIGEGDQSGFCTCVTDSDCPQQACGSDGRCSITRERCTPGTTPDTCTGTIYCVNNGELGYCQIGRNCAPDEGITCADVRASRM